MTATLPISNNALDDHQRYLETQFSKHQLLPRLRKEFATCEEIDFNEIMLQADIPAPFGFDLLVQIALHRRADLPTMVGLLRRHLGDSQATADMLLKCAEADLLDWNTNLREFIVIYMISDELQEELDKYQFPLPMVVPPKTLKSNKDTGYLIGSGSVILKNNHHAEDVCLDHLNRMNRIPFAIDADTANMMSAEWKNLDKPKEGETRADFEKRRKAFEKYDRISRQVLEELTRFGNEFYLTHRYDKRGRTYCMGYHVTYQGATWNKAVVQLSEKEFIT